MNINELAHRDHILNIPSLELFELVKRIGYKLCRRFHLHRDDDLSLLWISFAKAIESYDITRGDFQLCYHYQAMREIQRHRLATTYVVALPQHFRGEEYQSVSVSNPDHAEGDFWGVLMAFEPEDEAQYQDLVEKLTASLNDKEKVLFNSFIIGDESQAEYAERHGINRQNVSHLVVRLKQKLMKIYKEKVIS